MAKQTYRTVLIERARPHRTRGRFRAVRVPHALLRNRVASTEPFKPVVDLNALAVQVKRDEDRGMAIFFAIIVSEVGIFAPAGFFSPSASPTEFALAVGTAFTTLLAGAAGWVLQDLYFARLRRAYGQVSVKALRTWLRERYALTVSEASLAPARDFLLVEQGVGSELPFCDDDGKTFSLVAGAGGLFVKEGPDLAALSAKAYAPSGTVAALNPAAGLGEAEEVAAGESTAELAALLQGDAQALHSRTASLLATLGNRALSVEHRHAVNRAHADVNQLLVLNRELTELGEVDAEAQAQLAQVLSNLNGELVEVLEAERGAIKRSIATQVDYVKQRRLTPGNPALQLSAAERLDRHLLALDPEPRLTAAMRKVAELEEASE